MALTRTSFKKGQVTNPKGRPKGGMNHARREIKEHYQEFLYSAEYQQNLKLRILSGQAPHLETLMHHYAFGKPIDRIAPVNPDGETPYGAGNLTEEERLERIVFLFERVRERLALTAPQPVPALVGSATGSTE